MGLVTRLAAFVFLVLVSSRASAQTLTSLLSFNGTNGQYPEGNLTLSADGSTLYGMASFGGANGDGTVFSIPVSGGTPTTLLSFNGTNGENPFDTLTLSDTGSTLYGMTSNGGANGDGAVFSIPVSGGTPTTLLSFNGTNGENPSGGLTLRANGSTLYGMTSWGGANGIGTVFSIPVSGGTPTTLLSFNGTNGENPLGGLTLSANGSLLYGMTTNGGANGYGTVFSVHVGGGTPTTLLSFNGTNGENPFGSLTLSANGSTLYGMTHDGGANDYGTVFSIPVSGGTPTTMLSFNGTNGENPCGSLTLSANGSTLYGMTRNGGANGYGTVFSIPVSGGTPTTLLSFNVTNGENPLGSLTLTADGSTLYGMTCYGGANNHGTVFALNIAPATINIPNSSSATIITGGTGTVGMTLTNSPSSGYNLNYTVAATVQCGTATLGTITSGTGSLAPSASQFCSVSATSTSLGDNSISFAASDPNASNSPQTATATLTVLGHAAPNLSISTGNNQTVIAGASGITAALTLSNGTLTQTGLASLDVNSLGSGVAGSTGGSVVAAGSSQSYTATVNATTLGTQSVSFSLNVGDDHTLSGASAPIDLSTTATLTVLGHAVPSLSVSTGNNQTVIVGATGISLNLSNGTSGQSGLASLDINSLGTGVSGPTGGALVASGSSQSYTATLSTGTFGPQTQTFSMNVGDDHTLPGASAATDISTTAALTVYDHSNASLSSSATQTMQTIDFGNVLRGATIPSQSFTIYNQAANTSAAYTANLKLTGLNASGDGALTTNVSSFNGLAAGSGTTCSASLNTNNYTTSGITTITMSASQLVDDSSLPGAGDNNNGGITITLQGNVGNATADASNSQTSFGAALAAPVGKNASYANLESKVTATTGSGGAGMVGSTATILAGTNSSSGSAQTVSMAWRTQASSEGTRLVSDVLDLSGMALNDVSGETSPFVLQMDYDPGSLGGDVAVMASEEMIQLVWLNPATGNWENAIDGNFGTNFGNFYLGAWPNGDMTLGDWGVNTANHTVWAVLDHNSDFAVVPEPSTLILLAGSALGLAGFWRRRKHNPLSSAADGSAAPAPDNPAILPFRPMSTRRLESARRAA